jgi:hypothetical protein
MTDIPASRALHPASPGGGSRPPLSRDPVVLPGSTIGSMTDQICAIALRERAFLWWWIAMIPAAVLTGVLVAAILWLFYAGVGIWGIDWPVVWGFAIINYVWWIAIASGGTFISALFYLAKVEWRTSLNRVAETMTVFAAACAGIYPVLHLGRPWLFYWLFPFPNTMTLWPQFRSPLLWDFFAIFTYVTSSILFRYLGLIPDLATMRDRAEARGKQILYGAMALGFAARTANGGITTRPMASSRRSWRRWSSPFTASSGWISPVPPPSDGIPRSSRPSLFSAPCCLDSPWCCCWWCRCAASSISKPSSPGGTSISWAKCCW